MLIDDIDGGEAHETVQFALDGLAYEIDLSTPNASKLRATLDRYIEVSARVGHRAPAVAASVAPPKPTSGGRGRKPAVPERDQNMAIRNWAIRKGLAVSTRGRIKQEIIEQYHREAGRH
jgi:hypothetical protein